MSLSLNRIGLVAARDYKATITSRGFLIGLLIMPVLLVIFFVLVPRILTSHSPQASGEEMVIDPTATITAQLQQPVTPVDTELRRSMEAGQNPAAPPAQRTTTAPPAVR